MSIAQKTRSRFSLPDTRRITDQNTRDFGDDIGRELDSIIRKIYEDFYNLFDNPSFSVHKGGTNQTAVASGTATKVTFSTEEWDSHSYFASSKFTPLVGGRYILTGAVQFTVGVAASLLELMVYKNGAEYKRVSTVFEGTGQEGASISVQVDADGIDDYFELYAKQSTGGDKIIDGTATHTWFQGYKLPIVGK